MRLDTLNMKINTSPRVLLCNYIRNLHMVNDVQDTEHESIILRLYAFGRIQEP